MPTIDERCYGHEPAATELLRLRTERDALRALLRLARPFIEDGSAWCYDDPQQWLEDRIDAAIATKAE